ncbi:MAG: Aamy protein, partial [Actinobacteria bacterium]|nr:Aamy protein [Actinomycetota bacterium]
IDTSLDVGDDFLGECDEVLLDPPDCYVANPRSTVVLIGK